MKLRKLISENVFRNWTKIIGNLEFQKFIRGYKSLDKQNVVKQHKDDWYGYKKGSRELDWKYDENTFKLYSDWSDQEVYKIKNK